MAFYDAWVFAIRIGGRKMQEKEITEKQREVLVGIVQFKEHNGYAPTVRELCSITGLKSTSTVASHLRTLRDLGIITWIDTMPRTITVLRNEVAV